jgi:predicted nicotinamide N-methyase
MPPDEREAFIRSHTVVASPPLVPEVRLQLATEVTPLWQATEELLKETGLPPPFWAFAWPGGQALARHVLDHPELVRGKRVLDFASGGGVSAIAAVRAGAAAVLATEIDAFAVSAIALNCGLNDVQLETRTADVIDTDEGWDVVFAGDVCYEKPVAERIGKWLRVLAGRGAFVLMGDPGRTYLPKSGLVEVARHLVPTSKDLEDKESRDTSVWRVVAE